MSLSYCTINKGIRMMSKKKSVLEVEQFTLYIRFILIFILTSNNLMWKYTIYNRIKSNLKLLVGQNQSSLKPDLV